MLCCSSYNKEHYQDLEKLEKPDNIENQKNPLKHFTYDKCWRERYPKKDVILSPAFSDYSSRIWTDSEYNY